MSIPNQTENILDSQGSQGGCSVLGSVPSVIDEIRFLENGTDRFQKNLGTEHFGSRLFRFGSGSNRTNRIFSANVNTIKKMQVLKKI